MALPEVNGRAFLGLIRVIKDRYGEDSLRAVVKAAGDATQYVFAEQVRIMSWYPYAAYTRFLTAADLMLGKGDGNFCRMLGEFAGKRDLGTILKVYVALASAERLIRSCTKVWPSYHRNAGRMEAIEWSPQRTVLRIFDFPDMHPHHCLLMVGWMSSAMKTIGFLVAHDFETRCMSRGDPFHEFTCRWTRG